MISILQKSVILVAIFCMPLFLMAQSKQEITQQIDSLIYVAQDVYFVNGSTAEFVNLSEKILKLSDEINYDKGFANGYYYIATSYLDAGNYKEAITYLQKSLSYKTYMETDGVHKARVYFHIAESYRFLELSNLATENYHKAIKIINKELSETDKELAVLSAYYSGLAFMYNELNQKDSVQYYLRIMDGILADVQDKEFDIEKADVSITWGDYYLDFDIDSANFYYENALRLLKGRNHFNEAFAWEGIARVQTEKRNYNEALEAYLEAAEWHKVIEDMESLSNAYQAIGILYSNLGDKEKSNQYFKMHVELKNLYVVKKNQDRDFIVKELLKFEKENSTQKIRKNLIYTSLIFISVLLIILLYYFQVKRKKRKVLEKLEETEKNVQQLNQIVNESVEGILRLATENDPQFWHRFQEIYPEYIPKMKSINQNFTPSELKLGAYIYLGFTTKEIAEYTFRSFKTVENTRYNLRKKMKISADENLKKWFKEFIDSC